MFHTAVLGVTSCHSFYKQSVTAAGRWADGGKVPCSVVLQSVISVHLEGV